MRVCERKRRVSSIAYWTIKLLIDFYDTNNCRNCYILVVWYISALSGEIETVAENVESALEMAEKVAAAAEKVSEEVAASLPSDGKLKDAALFVEHVSEEARREAELTLKLIREVYNFVSRLPKTGFQVNFLRFESMLQIFKAWIRISEWLNAGRPG